MELTFKANRGELTGRILNYKSVELIDGSPVTIVSSAGRVTGQVWKIDHPQVRRTGILTHPTATTLTAAKKLASEIFSN